MLTRASCHIYGLDNVEYDLAYCNRRFGLFAECQWGQHFGMLLYADKHTKMRCKPTSFATEYTYRLMLLARLLGKCYADDTM